MAACSGTLSGRAICWVSALAASVVLAQATISLAAAEAQINIVGDVLEISVSGVPELRQRAAVNADGEIFLPLLGGIKVIGLRPQQRAGADTNKVFRRRTPEGRGSIVAIYPDEVAIDVVGATPRLSQWRCLAAGRAAIPPGAHRSAGHRAGGRLRHHALQDDPVMKSEGIRSSLAESPAGRHMSDGCKSSWAPGTPTPTSARLYWRRASSLKSPSSKPNSSTLARRLIRGRKPTSRVRSTWRDISSPSWPSSSGAA